MPTNSVALLAPGSVQATVPARGGGPVLAVLVEDHPVHDLLERASALARARGTRLQVLLLRTRTPLSTDPALIARLAERRRQEVDRLARVLGRWVPDLPSSPELVTVPDRALRSSGPRAWREVEAVARRRAASVAVVPPSLAVAARSSRSGRRLDVVVVGGVR